MKIWSLRETHIRWLHERVRRSIEQASWLKHTIGNTMQASINLMYLSQFRRQLRQVHRLYFRRH